MPLKRGKKRDRTSNGTAGSSNGGGDGTELQPPDRATWTGWVEMESEPAFFNVMLSEMGVKGVKVQEVVSLDDQMMAFLPRPVHALIFLFRYREDDREQAESDGCPKHIWFANQTPDFACATFALLNTVFNIPGLEVDKELREFKAFTQDMNPMSRGDAVDGFEFVRRIHNSFARETDMLQADMYVKNKAAGLKKRQATQKAKETREARKAEQVASRGVTKKDSPAPARCSARQRTSTLKNNDDAEFQTTNRHDPNDDAEDGGKSQPRRSGRAPKPRKDILATDVEEDNDAQGFHFIAYMPINGHVWKLDGLDRYPQDMGSFEGIGKENWMTIVQPALEGRMAQFAGAELEFNLMALVHDSNHSSRQELLRNIKTLHDLDKKLDAVMEGWRSLDGGETTRDLITTESVPLNITAADVASTELPFTVQKKIEAGELMDLMALRKDAVSQQASLRGMVRDAAIETKDDEKKARHRRHDYSTFVRSWLRALAEEELLGDLLTDD